jgi:hypothetical protein
MENVIWKPIKGFEDYQISNFGRVKSFKKVNEKILKPGIDGAGYLSVVLSKNKKAKTKTIHQLVACAFLGHKICGHTLVVNHIDFNKLNNNLLNLEIITQRENASKKNIKSSSKYTGVFLCKKSNKWDSGIKINGKKEHLGRFNNELDAHNAYQNKLSQLNNK